jgi:hypothetical protein
VAGGVDPASQRAHLVDTRRVRQEGKHMLSLPMSGGDPRRRRADRTVVGCDSPSPSTNLTRPVLEG